MTLNYLCTHFQYLYKSQQIKLQDKTTFTFVLLYLFVLFIIKISGREDTSYILKSLFALKTFSIPLNLLFTIFTCLAEWWARGNIPFALTSLSLHRFLISVLTSLSNASLALKKMFCLASATDKRVTCKHRFVSLLRGSIDSQSLHLVF